MFVDESLAVNVFFYMLYSTVIINSSILAYYTGKMLTKATVRVAARYPKKRQ